MALGQLREQERDGAQATRGGGLVGFCAFCWIRLCTRQAELAEVKKQLASAETRMTKDGMELQMLRRVGDIQAARLEDVEKQQRMAQLALEDGALS